MKSQQRSMMGVGIDVDTMEFIKDIANSPLIWNRDTVTNKLGCDEIWRELSRKYNVGGAFNKFRKHSKSSTLGIGRARDNLMNRDVFFFFSISHLILQSSN